MERKQKRQQPRQHSQGGSPGEYVPEAREGEYVIVHVGFAISVLDEAEALQTFKYLKQMGELEELESKAAES